MTSPDIRLVEDYEVALLLPGARSFFAEGLIAGKLNERHYVATLSKYIASGIGFVLASGSPFRGAIGGILFPDMATAETVCMEYFWYVHPEERGSLGVRLLDAFEKEAAARGAVRIQMAHFVSPETEKFKRLYERRDYTLKEQIFQKDLVQ